MAFIKIKNLSFSRGKKKIFDKTKLEIKQGSIVAILGPSGCGKTTLLRLIAGQLKPQQGSVTINNTKIGKLSWNQLLEFRKNIGFLFQSGALFTDLNVYENVAFPLKVNYSLPKQTIDDLVNLKLECVGLRGAQKLMPRELSGGMHRRVALARAIALDPMLMLYDEPFTGQDPISKGVIMELIKIINDNLGITSILVSHDISETFKIADYVYILADSKVIGRGNPQSLKAEGSPLVKQFLYGRRHGPVAFHHKAAQLEKSLGVRA